MTKLSPLVFFGTESFSAQILQALIDSDFAIEAVITKPDLVAGRGRKTKPSDVKSLAQKHNFTVFEVKNKDDIRSAVQKTSKQTGVLASFGKIIPTDVIDTFTNGIINVHPSLLPKYRGASPIESAILNGDQKTGVSIMLLATEVDAGDVYAQIELTLNGQETAAELYDKLAKLGGGFLIDILNKIEKNHLQATPQNHSQATFCQMITKTDADLDPTKDSAEKLERKIRAYQTWPKAHLLIDNKSVIVLSATVNQTATSPINFKCANGKYLNIETLLSPNGKATSAIQYYNNFLR